MKHISETAEVRTAARPSDRRICPDTLARLDDAIARWKAAAEAEGRMWTEANTAEVDAWFWSLDRDGQKAEEDRRAAVHDVTALAASVIAPPAQPLPGPRPPQPRSTRAGSSPSPPVASPQRRF